MSAALARITRNDASEQAPAARGPAAAPTLDAAALQALAADAAREFRIEPAQGADRRGPFRPERLVSTRARRSGLMALRFCRPTDAVVLSALASVVALMGASGPLAQAPIAAVLPAPVAALVSLWAMRMLGLYRFGRDETLGRRLGIVSLALAAGAAAGIATLQLAGFDMAGGLALALWTTLASLTLNLVHLGWWATARRWRREGRLTPNVVVVGATRHAERLIRAALDRGDVNIIGVFDDRLARAPQAIAGVPVLGDTGALLDHKIAPCVDRVVVALDPSAKTRVREVLGRLRVLPNEVTLLVDLETEDQRAQALSRLADSALSDLAGSPEDERRAFAKRVQDLVLGTVALVALSPLLALIALAVKLDSPGPAFFRQRRHGFNNEAITVWKFRTLRHEAADARAERQVTADDDRVTKLGRFLRRTSLDELPQLLNVVRGEMSLVGPRPHAIGMKTGEAESSRLVAEYAWRHRMKPGMTGWAAIKGSRGPLHSAADVRRRVALDIEYIDRQSFWLDLYVMVVTLPCLLGDRQAAR